MEIDYLANWPEQFYKLGDASDRRKALDAAIAAGLEAEDGPRAALFSKRYNGTKQGSAEPQDNFMYSWLMIHALSETDYLFKKPVRKKLGNLLAVLGIDATDYTPVSVPITTADSELLRLEWKHMAGLYISSCLGSKSYGAYLSLIPMKRDTKASHLMHGVDGALVHLPEKLGMAQATAPLYEVMEEVFQSVIIEN